MSSPTPAETSAGVAVGLHRRIPMRIRRPPAIHKKPQSPQAHVSQAIHRNPCLAASHTPRIPIQAISSHNHNLTMRPPRPAAGLRKSPTGSVTQVHWASDRLERIHASNQLTQIPPSNDRGAWVRHRFAMRRRRCVDATSRRQGEPAPVLVRPEGRTCSRAFRLNR